MAAALVGGARDLFAAMHVYEELLDICECYAKLIDDGRNEEVALAFEGAKSA